MSKNKQVWVGQWSGDGMDPAIYVGETRKSVCQRLLPDLMDQLQGRDRQDDGAKAFWQYLRELFPAMVEVEEFRGAAPGLDTEPIVDKYFMLTEDEFLDLEPQDLLVEVGP